MAIKSFENDRNHHVYSCLRLMRMGDDDLDLRQFLAYDDDAEVLRILKEMERRETL